MKNKMVIVLWLSGLAILVSSACRPPLEGGHLRELQDKIRAGDERALREVTRLPSPEDRVLMIPAMIDAYNANLNRQDIVSILAELGHPDGAEVFLMALRDDNVRLAGLGARGLAAIGAADNVRDVAERLSRIRDPQQYEPFFDALRRLPGRPEVAPVISEILMRPAGRIGGVNTVRYGCRVLGSSGANDESTIRALVFGLVNFIPMPPQDPLNDCALALVQIGDDSVPILIETFLGQNQAVNEHLTSLGFTREVGGLRAGKVIASLGSPAALEPMLEWFGTHHQVSASDLASMNIEQAMNWFANFGQQFMYAAEFLGVIGRPADDDPARTMLRGLISRGAGQSLENFRDFMGTSDDAEIGLRAAAIRALTNIGNPVDREPMLEMALSGTLARASNAMIRQESAHAFALLSRPGDLVRYQELLNNTSSAQLREELEAYRGMVEIAENCQGRVSCLEGFLRGDNVWLHEKAAYDLAHFSDNPMAAAEALLAALDVENLDSRLNYLLALRRLPWPATADRRLDDAWEAASEPIWTEFRYNLRVLQIVKARE